MLGLALASVLAAKSVLILDLTPTADVPASTAQLLTELISDRTAKDGLKTVSAADLRRVSQLNAERSAVGCDTSSCLAELANAMGVDLVVFGDVGTLGSTNIVTLRLYDANVAEAVGRETLQGGSVDDLRTGIPSAVDRLLRQGGFVVEHERTPNGALLWTGAGVGVAGAVAAVALGGWAFSFDNTAADVDVEPAARLDALNTGRQVLAGAGAAGVAAVVGGGLVAAAYVFGGE